MAHVCKISGGLLVALGLVVLVLSLAAIVRDRDSYSHAALAAERCMRNATVSSERLSIQQECGSSWVPIALRKARIGFRPAREPMTAPAMRSLWPPTYFVSE